jgi:hypothetical protein
VGGGVHPGTASPLDRLSQKRSNHLPKICRGGDLLGWFEGAHIIGETSPLPEFGRNSLMKMNAVPASPVPHMATKKADVTEHPVRYSTTSAYSSTSLPAMLECSSSSHPTTVYQSCRGTAFGFAGFPLKLSYASKSTKQCLQFRRRLPGGVFPVDEVAQDAAVEILELAQHVVMTETQLPILANEIEVY